MVRFANCLLLSVLILAMASTADAQLLRRNRVAQAGPSCPGGVCPTAVAAPQAGHWSFPGTIDSHLEGTHGVSSAGLSRQQKLDLHDSLHEGTAPVVRATPIVNRGVYKSVGSAVSYGSTGGYGSSGGSFRVGGYDSDGSVILSIGSSEASAMWFGSRKRSRQVIVEAAEKAQAEGTIDASQLQAIKLAARSPRMLARIEDLILEKAQASGAYQFQLDRNGDIVASAINWEAIGDFILKIAPLIFKLIEMFAIYEQAGNIQGMAMVLDHLDYLATIHWQAQMAC